MDNLHTLENLSEEEFIRSEIEENVFTFSIDINNSKNQMKRVIKYGLKKGFLEPQNKPNSNHYPEIVYGLTEKGRKYFGVD